MLDELEGHLLVMRENVYRAEAAGNLDDLRSRTEKT
jgi:hypothetical protein